MLAILGPSKKHQKLRADQRREQQPQTEIVDSLARQSVATRQPNGHKDRGQKSEGEKHSIRVDGEIKDAKKNWVHEQ